MSAPFDIAEVLRPLPLRLKSYADYIAHRIVADLRRHDPESIIKDVTMFRQRDGSYTRSTAKVLEVIDMNGVEYIVTIERKDEIERDTVRKAVV